MKTTATKKKDTSINWHLIDVKDKPLGRISVDIVNFLTGKHKVDYAPYLKNSDKVVVINASDVALTRNKEEKKKYISHSQYAGGIRTVKASQVREHNPKRLITDAVRGMLPKNKLRDKRMSNLYIYTGSEHKHEAQLKNNG